ncbi:MAG: MFS transporter [Deltaproteobacteria bacterium]|nr:MFS transporter [Deltaproteobacteria bacterium]
MPPWLQNLVPIALLLTAILLVVRRLPRIEVGHSEAFRRRRIANWLPLGLTYAFLYFGRYNINEATTAIGKVVDNAGFGTIFAVGAWVYGVSFLVNGPLTDRIGGRRTILIAALGSAFSNLLMAGAVYALVGRRIELPGGVIPWLSALFGLNMYFQSFGAVSIVKVNAAWFHVRERGVQGGVFGILISLGIYFGYDWSRAIGRALPDAPWLIFVIPAVILVAMFVVDLFLVHDAPSDTGHPDFDVGDATGSDDHKLSVGAVFAKMLKNRVILIIVAIEFCTGYLRNGVMSWYPKFAKAVDLQDDFVSKNWGLLLCVFGIIGGMFAGIISDRVFHSRRGPVASVLYAGITIGAIAMLLTLEQRWVGWVLVFMALNYVGVHGMLSGTASADFGGRKNTGVAVGIIDGFVYLGTGMQSLVVGLVLPTGDAAKSAANWTSWPVAMVPLALLGLALCATVWNAKPKPGGGH